MYPSSFFIWSISGVEDFLLVPHALGEIHTNGTASNCHSIAAIFIPTHDKIQYMYTCCSYSQSILVETTHVNMIAEVVSKAFDIYHSFTINEIKLL